MVVGIILLTGSMLFAVAQGTDIDCPGFTTDEINYCVSIDIARAEECMDRYLQVAGKALVDERTYVIWRNSDLCRFDACDPA